MDLSHGLHRRDEHGKFYAALAQELITYGEWAFRQSRRRPDGASEADHGDAASRIAHKFGSASKIVHVTAVKPVLPRTMVYLWETFLEVISGCAPGYGPAVISWEALRAWMAVTGVDLDPWECRTIVRLGVARADVASEANSGSQN